MSSATAPERPGIDVFFAFESVERRPEAIAVMADLRRRGLMCETDYAGRSLKGQLTQARRLGARAVLITSGDRITLRRPGEKDVELETLEEARELL